MMGFYGDVPALLMYSSALADMIDQVPRDGW